MKISAYITVVDVDRVAGAANERRRSCGGSRRTVARALHSLVMDRQYRLAVRARIFAPNSHVVAVIVI
jgi:hypothetical protein